MQDLAESGGPLLSAEERGVRIGASSGRKSHTGWRIGCRGARHNGCIRKQRLANRPEPNVGVAVNRERRALEQTQRLQDSKTAWNLESFVLRGFVPLCLRRMVALDW